MDAAVPAPAIVRLRPAPAALPLPPVEHDGHAGRAGERPREMVEDRRALARDDDEEAAPLAHTNDLKL